MLAAGFFFACSQTASLDSKNPPTVVSRPENSVPTQSRKPVSERTFQPPNDLDRMLDANPLESKTMDAHVRPAPGSTSSANENAANTGKGHYHIQIAAETDFDIAQAKQQEYEKKLSGGVDMIFDAPYYKLRWGSFDTRQEAEDRLLDISDLKVQGFVVKQ